MFLLRALTLGLLCLIPNFAIGQLEGSIDVTGTYSFGLETPGINIRSYLFATDAICLGPEFTYFFPRQEQHGDEEITLSAFTLDLNAHYVFPFFEHRLGLYPILGVAYLQEMERIEVHNEIERITQRAGGFNLGGGVEVRLSRRINLFSEYIHTFSSLRDDVVFLGFNYRWGAGKKGKMMVDHHEH